jgi:hypothetical protein|eukprot:COSAG01_NODE_102_length_26290_cov_94.760299_11_plen_83_part_00
MALTPSVRPSNAAQANVLCEYPVEDAQALLTENRDNAQVNLKSLDEDVQFLRDQITTTEVNIARIFNYDVMKRKALKGPQTD